MTGDRTPSMTGRTQDGEVVLVQSLPADACPCRSGPEFWSQRYPACGGWRQSPINIDTSLVRFREDIPRLHLHHYHHVTRQGGFPQIVYFPCLRNKLTTSRTFYYDYIGVLP